ncbi:MAG: DUF2997 domain-containing protein [Limnoraphis sp.]
MQYYRIELTINPDATISEKVIASGSNCTAVTEELEQELGQVKSQEILSEYYQESVLVEDEKLWISE